MTKKIRFVLSVLVRQERANRIIHILCIVSSTSGTKFPENTRQVSRNLSPLNLLNYLAFL